METETATYVAAPETSSKDIGGEQVVLNLRDGSIYGLNEIGARVWELLHVPQTLAQLESLIVAEYDVDLSVARVDITRLIEDLRHHTLVEVVGQGASSRYP